MLTEHNYTGLPKDTWNKKIKECCDQKNPDTPQGSDCCYDVWVKELKEVSVDYKDAEEKAKQIKCEYEYVAERRDQFKKWYDELTKTNDLAKAICDQLELMCGQVDKVNTNTCLTVKAIKILFCMLRDYFLQLDLLKTKYDELMECIKCLKTPVLIPGAGLMKCIEEYGVKLEAAIAFRDELIKMVMEALNLAEKIDHNLDADYGLETVLTEWKETFNCDESCSDASEGYDQAQKKSGNTQGMQDCSDNGVKECELKPMLSLPVCKDPYYKKTFERYTIDKTDAEKLASDLVELNKRKESLLACKQSLEAAIKEVDPKTRCK